MRPKVLFTSPAQIDLSSIAEYIATNSIQAAEDFYDTVHEKCDELAQMPQMGKLRIELDPSVRSFPLGALCHFLYHPRGHDRYSSYLARCS